MVWIVVAIVVVVAALIGLSRIDATQTQERVEKIVPNSALGKEGTLAK